LRGEHVDHRLLTLEFERWCLGLPVLTDAEVDVTTLSAAAKVQW